jgi:nucleoid-associated protein YgaU
LVIEELSGDQRYVELIGRALPTGGPLVFEGHQRVETTWYPGNPIASQQILGPSEEPTEITGTWKDRFIAATDQYGQSVVQAGAVKVNMQSVVDVTDAVNLLDDIRRKGQLVEVSWEHLRRRGILKKFRHSWKNIHDVEWAMTFEWQSQGETLAPSVMPEPDQTDITTTLQAKASSLTTSVNPLLATVALLASAVASVTGFVENVLNDVTDLIDIAQAIVNLVMAPIEAAKHAIATLNKVSADAKDTMQAAEQRVAAAFVAAPSPAKQALISPASAPAPAFGQVLSAHVYIRGVKLQARQIRGYAAQQIALLSARAGVTSSSAVFVASADDNLRDVSTRFYGTPNQWRDIAAHNGLRGSRLVAGQIVRLPPKQVAARPRQ